MAASRTTRRGNGAGHGGPKAGAGWGGPAKGAAELRPLAPKGDPYSDAVRDLSHAPDVLANAEQVKAQMRAVLYQIALAGEAEAVRMNAADKLLDRLEGKPVQRQDLTSKGERIGYVIAAPQEAESSEAWAKQHQPP